MNNLCIDIGNSLIKTGVFIDSNLVHFEVYKSLDINKLHLLVSENHINNVITSDSGEFPSELKDFLLQSNVRWITLNSSTLLPIEILYETPNSLGKDRIAVAVGANFIYPHADILIIDAGTAITYEFINHKGQYLGGNISPGITMRYKALNTFTHKLPIIEPSLNFPLFGKNTTDAIRGGVQSGIIYEVDETINRFKALYPELHVILTGGDIKFFDNKLKNAIFVVSNLLMVGLNRILTYNVQNI